MSLGLSFDFLCLYALVGTFGSSQHGGGQFTLLGLYMAESEPAGEAVGYH